MADPLDMFRPRERQVARSILDRLLDDAPYSSADPMSGYVDQVRDMRECIRRDLEALLNSRKPIRTPPAKLVELQNSLLGYGIDGAVSANLITDEAKLMLARSIERRIRRFETRLDNIQVTILKSRTVTERALRLRIEATFRLHDGMPPISFESTIDPATQRFRVDGGRSAEYGVAHG
ncbi:type VI secretion system baseplate subunit TssE [Rhizobium sp. AAP43]|uniref:type VI secretion system baseplate subunit TssE n=1 Tax=Rhizobium sp. AAP43 TaxID=1523420 RepID=UPI0006B89EC9|nr:type VI secretion system baseplate subunit TssE [Rhizobium sp. AAP43]KPF45774.1 type VI secretion protein [Rhizobium sp. AAP43]